jgi:hypothetical protein
MTRGKEQNLASGLHVTSIMRTFLFVGIVLAVSSAHLAFEKNALHRMAFWAASASLGLTLVATAVAARMFSSQMSPSSPVWMSIPALAGAAGMVFAARAASGPLWACAGAMVGFALLGAWSIGFAYVPAAWAMLIAAIVQPPTTRNMVARQTIRAVLFTIAGASILGVFGLLLDWWRTTVIDYSWQTPTGFGHVHEARIVSHAPIIVWASWVFVAVAAALCVDAWVSYRRHQARGDAP